MAISLSRLFADSEKLYDIRLIAGRTGMESLVRWVHIIEDAEVTGFIHGNELIFTTGITHRDNEWIADFTKMLRDHGAVGVVLNLGPYITAVPQRAIDLCDEMGFPLFTIPWEKRLIDVTFDYCHRIIANEEHEAGLAYAFRNLIFNPSNPEGYAHTLFRRGFPENGRYTMLVVQAYRQEEAVREDEWHNARFEIEAELKSMELPLFPFVQQNRLVLVLMNHSTYAGKANIPHLIDRAVRGKLLADTVFVGISEETRGYDGIPGCYRQALIAGSIAHKSGALSVNYSDIGVYKLLYAVNDRTVLREFCNSTLGAVKQYDSTHGTDCMQLLETYIRMGCSVQAVSEALGVHRNTVNYKIRMLRTTFGFDFSNKNIADLVMAFVCRDILDKQDNG